MKFIQLLPGLIVLTTLSSLSCSAAAQSAPTATQQLQLSVFVAGSGNFTGLAGGKNLDITAGADLTLLTFRLFSPSIEVRGSYPIDEGHISSQKSILVGPKVDVPLGRLHPYADFLFGRGGIDYLNGGYIYGYFKYLSTNTPVYSPGIGLDYNLTHSLAVKADFQYQHWDTPTVASGSIHPKVVTLGGVYTFDFNPRHRHTQ